MDEEDQKREVILRFGRQVIRNCSDSIKKIHRGDIAGAKEKLEQASKLFNQINEKKEHLLNTNIHSSLQTPYQEYAEAYLLLYFIEHRKLISSTDKVFTEVQMPHHCYVLGLCDFGGELGRMFLDVLRKGNIDEANDVFEFLQEIYINLISLDYPNGLIPGFKRKVDVVRFVLEKARNTLTQAVVTGFTVDKP
ncbi:MAG: hypothetical protein ACTSRU_15720 [Candidatus Hodarchaeales archaeon]